MDTRIYRVKVKDKKDQLVRAGTPAAAIRHVAKGIISADVASQDDIVELASDGVKVESANAD